MTDCIFCKIINNEIPSSKIYEDNKTLAFMDIMPVNKGHALVIPKEHHETLFDLPDDILKAVIMAVKKIGDAVKKAVNADGINIGVNNHKAAGQVVFHSHFHIIPRFNDDGLKTWPHKKYEDDEMPSYAEAIRKYL